MGGAFMQRMFGFIHEEAATGYPTLHCVLFRLDRLQRTFVENVFL